MIKKIFSSIKGRHNRKYIDACMKRVQQVHEHASSLQRLSDEQLQAKTPEFMERYKNGESLDALLPEAFAVVKEGASRLCNKTFVVCDNEQTWNMVHYDVQMVGGIALHENKIAEMATGEGKTLVATLPLYLNALTGRNCQLVTVNDYLARRDSEWMGNLYKFLGLTVGCIQNGQSPAERGDQYTCNITYGTASEFGFDYLRDNGMATRKEDQVQRDHYFVIVDETDSVLIDEARTPLIISGPVESDRELPFHEMKPGVQSLVNQQSRFCTQLVQAAKEILEKQDDSLIDEAVAKLWQVKKGAPKNKILMRLLEDGQLRKRFDRFEGEMASDFNKKQMFALKEELFYVIDEKQHSADLTEKGREHLAPGQEDAFVIPDLPYTYMQIDADTGLSPEQKQAKKQQAEKDFELVSERIHCLSQLLRAYSIYERDKEYVVQDNKVMIVDENTGRIMPGRRWGDGLHQAVEAKENVAIEKESKTFATITIQNYFRMYDKLAGMTGTAETEAQEFFDIYKLSVAVIPTNKPCLRIDDNDVIYKTRREKLKAVIADISEAHAKGQPILVGTTSVEASEVFSRALRSSRIPHNILNAKYHQQEAEIVARAGQRGAVTIATNMAGRGTDIKLGEGVAELGGLFVVGTERHDSRRIDRQLRGRCARQGDPGRSKFFVSLEDDLMRLFANAGPISKILEKTFEEGDQLEHPLLNRSIESAQKKVEQHYYSNRKRLLQYDDVLNRQREVVYGIRNEAIHSETPRDLIFEMVEEEIQVRSELVHQEMAAKGSNSDQVISSFLSWVNGQFPIALKENDIAEKSEQEIAETIISKIQSAYDEKASFEDKEAIFQLERYVIIRSIDKNWQDHLTEIEDLRRSVGLRSYGQKDPLSEYKSEAFTYFEQMMNLVREGVCQGLFRSTTNLEAFQNMLARLNKEANVSGPQTAQAPAQTSATQRAAQPSAEAKRPVSRPRPVQRSLPKIGRNETVMIRRGKETQEVKFKKAESMILNEGWVLVAKAKK